MELRNSQGSMKNLLNSPDINCKACESFISTCKDKMILNGVYLVYPWSYQQNQDNQQTIRKY